MNIGLIDVDSHNYPNLALMKISAYEKARGNNVEWWNGLKHYDRVYQAKVFDEIYTKDNEFVVQADEIIKGGTGYNLDGKLPDKIEHIYPDYELYKIRDTAYGFLTRGCPRHCDFCIVGDKEGTRAQKVADLSEFWKGQKNIEILDPNMLACKEREELLDQLIQSGARVNFNQGLDARLLTDSVIEKLNAIRTKAIHFAWDNMEEFTYEQLRKYREKLEKPIGSVIVYVLTNYNTTHEQDVYRAEKLAEAGYDPYIMIYNKPKAPKKTKELARWANAKLFRHMRFSEYKGTKNG